MPRNLDTRVELLTPVEDAALRDDILDTLERSLADNVNAWELQPDPRPGGAGAPRARSAKRAARAHAAGHAARAAEGAQPDDD